MIPAVTHADGTARIQTVDRAVNPRYWELISEFEQAHRRAGDHEHVVQPARASRSCATPKDAIRTFYSSGLDFLVLGDCFVAKDPSGLAELGLVPSG